MQTIWFCIHSNFEDGGTSTSTYGLTASVFKGLHVGDFDWLWKEMKESDDVIGRLTWNMCLCSRQPSYPGMVPSWKSKWWRFFRLWTVFLSSGLFVGLPPTGWSGRAAIQTGVLHTLERSNTAMSLQMQCNCRTVSLRTGRLVLAYLFHLSIILHWCTPYQYIDAWLLS